MKKSRKSLIRPRTRAYNRQSGRCYYCDSPMWLEGRSKFAAKHGITKKQAKRFRCTAEHLIARQDGGTDDCENIVAACLHCNATRHRVSEALSPDKYKEQVMHFIRRQEWHPMEFHRML